MLLPEKLAANCDHILVADLSAIEKTHRLRLKRFLDCCSNVSSIAFRLRQKHEFSSSKPKVSPASSESRDDCGDAETFLGFLFFIPFPYNRLNPSVCNFLRGERSSKSNHAGKQRPCATQSELSLSCSGALNARSACSITGPEPRACTSTGCTGSTATSLCNIERQSRSREKK